MYKTDVLCSVWCWRDLMLRHGHTWSLDGVTAGRHSSWFGWIHPDTSPITALSLLFQPPTPRQHQRLRLLRLRPHCGPPTPAPVYPASPQPTSAGWPAGCPTPGPSSPRSSAAQDTQHIACTVTVATTTENTTPRHEEGDPVSQEWGVNQTPVATVACQCWSRQQKKPVQFNESVWVNQEPSASTVWKLILRVFIHFTLTLNFNLLSTEL